jgi:hypothetical protein
LTYALGVLLCLEEMRGVRSVAIVPQSLKVGRVEFLAETSFETSILLHKFLELVLGMKWSGVRADCRVGSRYGLWSGVPAPLCAPI